MTSSDTTTKRLPFLGEFSARDREAAETTARRQEERQRRAFDARALKAEKVNEQFRRRLHDLLGGRKAPALREAIRRERLISRDARQPPGGLTQSHESLRRATRRRIDALLRTHGVNRERVAKLILGHAEALQEIFAAVEGKVVPGFHFESNLDTWTSLSPLKVGSPIVDFEQDPNDPNRWFLERPPWFGFLFRFAHQASDNFQVGRQHSLDPSSGLVGNEVTLDCGGADDDDEATAIAEAQIAFGFRPPVAGVVEVLIDAQSLEDTHLLKIKGEAGFSHAWANQENYLMMNVLHANVPEPSLALMSRLLGAGGQPSFAVLVSGGDDFWLDDEYLVRGHHFFARLFSAGPVPAGKPVVVTVGTRSQDFGHVDDMTYHGRSNFRWFINSVQVRISP